jgi:hypothetical protein
MLKYNITKNTVKRETDGSGTSKQKSNKKKTFMEIEVTETKVHGKHFPLVSGQTLVTAKIVSSTFLTRNAYIYITASENLRQKFLYASQTIPIGLKATTGKLSSYLLQGILYLKHNTEYTVTLDICSFVHQCNTFTSYFLLIVDMFRPHTAIFRCYSILSRSWYSVMPLFAYVMLPAMC